MPRTKGGTVHNRKRKKVLKAAKGFRAGPGTLNRAAIEFTMRAGVYAYRDRRQKKRHVRTLWVTRLTAALKERDQQKRQRLQNHAIVYEALSKDRERDERAS